MYGDKISEKVKTMVALDMTAISDAIPSADVKEIGAAVRKLEKS